MSTSNRDRIGRGFELVAEGLVPFVDEEMSAAAPAGADWAQMIAARDAAKHGGSRSIAKNDPQTLLRVLTEEWRVFSKRLSRVEQSFATELRDTRNRWAHNEAFSSEDTSRALDTMERLLTAVGAVAPADEVRRSRMDHTRAAFEQETRKAVRQQDATIATPGQGLKPWREVLKPHEDVASGRLPASEFAADLHMVAQGEGADEYVDPVQFFRRTYITEGLRELLDRAVRRIGGDDNASPIINAQTNFGGGKTHSMLAAWHLFSGTSLSTYPQDLQDVVGSRTLPESVRRVAIVGTHLPPTGTEKPDGTRVNTIWGEIAWQLGGRAAYDMVAEADAGKTNPGGVLRQLIEQHSPCLILIDEWVAYARQLWGREDLAAGTFDTQFTFAQSLTEVVKTVSGALLVISIPASHDPDCEGESGGSAIEVGGPNGQEALQRLQNVVRRVADQWRPATAQESFEIVRRRLFNEPDAQATADIAAVARQFREFYLKHGGEFPREVVDPAYEARIRAAYPIHPELFDRLYQDWSTLDRFQRTRGVLRLVSTVVHALWVAQDPSPMILPGTVPLDAPNVTNEIVQYLPDAWKPILDADVDGPGSTPARIDRDRSTLGARAVTRRLARTTFIGSAPTLRSANRGIDRQRIWLGTAIPGDTVGNFGSGMELLTQAATYLYGEGSRYWYDTQPNVTRTAADHAEGLRERPEEVWAEIVRRLRGEQRFRGGFAAVHAAPDSSADIQDTEDARLVILHPAHPHSRGDEESAAMRFATDAFERRGSGQRVNRNMVVFLAPDAKRMEELAQSVRSYLAWSWVQERKDDLDLTPHQARQVEAQRIRADEDVAARISQTYHWALIPEQQDPAAPPQIAVERAEGSSERLAERVTDKLVRGGLLTGTIAPRSIRLELEQRLESVWSRGHVSVGDLWGYYCRYPYLTRLRDRSVLDEGVQLALSSFAWEMEAFALADGYDDATGLYGGLVIPSGDARFGQVTDATLLVAPEAATRQVTAARPSDPGEPDIAVAGLDDESRPGWSAGAAAGARPVGASPAFALSNTRFYGVYRLDPERYGRDLARLGQEILQQLSAVEGTTLDVTVEVHASNPAGFPEDKVRTVLENARTLKFEPAEFADE